MNQCTGAAVGNQAWQVWHFDCSQGLEIDFPELQKDPEQTGAALEGRGKWLECHALCSHILSSEDERLLSPLVSLLLSWQRTPCRCAWDAAVPLISGRRWLPEVWSSGPKTHLHQQGFYSEAMCEITSCPQSCWLLPQWPHFLSKSFSMFFQQHGCQDCS